MAPSGNTQRQPQVSMIHPAAEGNTACPTPIMAEYSAT